MNQRHLKVTSRIACSGLLTLTLLASCGGGGGGGGGQTPPPNPGGSNKSSIGGILISPGSLGTTSLGSVPDIQLSDAGAPIVQTDAAASWWADPAARAQRGQHSGETIPGQYLVRLNSGVRSQGLTTLQAGGVTLEQVRGLGLPGLYLYRAAGGKLAAQALSAQRNQAVVQALSERPDVKYAEPDVKMYALKVPNDTLLPVQWALPKMSLPAAWDQTTGTSTVVAVVDTGIVPHPDLAGKLLPGADFVQDTDISGDGDGFDLNPTDEGGDSGYHGTHVAGTIAAATNNGRGIAGVNWGARVVPVRVLGTSGGGALSDIILGIAWAAGATITGAPTNPNPASVVNLSLGGEGKCTQTQQELFAEMARVGITAVVAAGNENVNASNSSPANCDNVITVGAIGPDGTRAPYSNFGAKIDVMAPGGDMNQGLKVGNETFPGGILSTLYDPKSRSFVYGFYQGTSMAAPHVAGLAALLLTKEPGLTPAQIEARLKASSTPLSSAQCGITAGCGSGLVNANAALRGSTPNPNPTPTVPVPAPAGKVPTYVVAFYQLPQGFDQNRSVIDVFQPKLLRTPYVLQGVEPGKYLVGAWQDLDDDGEVDDNEPLGAYEELVTVDNVARTIIGIDIAMKPYVSSSLSVTATSTRTPVQSLARALELAQR